MKEQLISLETAKLAKEKGFVTDKINFLLKTHFNDVSRDGTEDDFIQFYKYTPTEEVWVERGGSLGYKEFIKFDTHELVSTSMSSSMCDVKWSYKKDNHSTYDHYLAVPQSVLQKWLRDVHGLMVYVIPTLWDNIGKRYNFITDATNDSSELIGSVQFSYEAALEQGLFETLKQLKYVRK